MWAAWAGYILVMFFFHIWSNKTVTQFLTSVVGGFGAKLEMEVSIFCICLPWYFHVSTCEKNNWKKLFELINCYQILSNFSARHLHAVGKSNSRYLSQYVSLINSHTVNCSLTTCIFKSMVPSTFFCSNICFCCDNTYTTLCIFCLFERLNQIIWCYELQQKRIMQYDIHIVQWCYTDNKNLIKFVQTNWHFIWGLCWCSKGK